MSRIPKNQKQKYNEYAKYSSIAFQMMITIVLFALGGFQLDKWLDLKFPVFAVLLSLAGVFIGIYYAIKDFIKLTDNRKNDNNKNNSRTKTS